MLMNSLNENIYIVIYKVLSYIVHTEKKHSVK